MDSITHNHEAKQRKMKAVLKKSRFQTFLELFYGAIEITLVMVTVAQLCYQLVITFESSGLSSFLINRHLAFFLGNVIVIGLVAKCGFFVNQDHDSQRNRNDFYDEFVRESTRGDRSFQIDVICREKQSKAENEAKQSTEVIRAKQSNEEKKQSSEVNRAKQSSEEKKQSREKQSSEDQRETKKETENSTKQSSGEEISIVKRQRKNTAQNQESTRQIYQRSWSENLEGSKKNSSGKLKRSETERYADGFGCDDELRCKIESFIARQRRNQKDEEFCIV